MYISVLAMTFYRTFSGSTLNTSRLFFIYSALSGGSQLGLYDSSYTLETSSLRWVQLTLGNVCR